MKIPCLIFGRGGLLGQQCAQKIRFHPHIKLCDEAERLRWDSSEVFQRQIEKQLALFSRLVVKHSSWMILWTAGSRVIGATRDLMLKDLSLYRYVLMKIGSELASRYPEKMGYVFLASSAGGVYGNTLANCVTEYSSPNPISEYGRGKLAQEKELTSFCNTFSNVTGIIGRISSLYGLGQNLSKSGQGFISQVSRSLIYRKPLDIFVPLDTLRDYLFTPDCADAIIRTLDHFRQVPESSKLIIKIFASEQSVSLARVLGIFSRLNSLPPNFLLGNRSISNEHASKLCLRSVVLPFLKPVNTPLEEGIAMIHREQLRMYLQGRLPQN